MLSIENISIGYGTEIARFSGSFAFAKAKFIAIIGPNGSGKSTLINALTTGDNLLNGNIKLDDKPISKYGPGIAEKMAVVRTQRDFSRQLSIQELLEFSLQNSLVEKPSIEKILADFDLAHLAQHRLSDLSDGQLQRALIARAIVQDTLLLIMDEPTNHLDIHHRTDILLQLKRYTSEQDKTIIFSSHELDLSLKLADTVISINQGMINIQNTPKFLKSNQLNQMFPSQNLSFDKGKIDFNV